MGRYSRPQDKQPVFRKGASKRTKSPVTLRNGINVIDMGRFTSYRVGEMARQGRFYHPAGKTSRVDWMRHRERHEKFLRIEGWRKNWVTRCHLPFARLYIHGVSPKRNVNVTRDRVYKFFATLHKIEIYVELQK